MSAITVSARSGAPEETAADTRVVGLFEGETLADPRCSGWSSSARRSPGCKKVAVAHEDAPGGGQRRVLIAGLGKRDEFDAERPAWPPRRPPGGPRSSARCRCRGRARAATAWPAALVEGTLLKLYSFDRFKSQGERRRGRTGSSRSRSRATRVDAGEVERARVAAIAANAARDLQNLPANVATPSFLAERAGEIADQHEALELELLDRDGDRGARHGRVRRRSRRAPTPSRG